MLNHDIIVTYVHVGPRPLDVFLKIIPYRLFMGVVLMIFVWWAKVVRGTGEGPFPMYFYIIFLLVFTFYQVMLCNIKLFFISVVHKIGKTQKKT